MVKYKGSDVEVRIATSEAGLASAPAIPYVSSVEWNVEQNVEASPKGIGYRTQEAYEGLVEITGTIERWWDTTAVSGSDLFETAVGAFTSGPITPLYIEIKKKTENKKVIIKKAKGSYTESVDVDGYITQTWDFTAEEIAYA